MNFCVLNAPTGGDLPGSQASFWELLRALNSAAPQAERPKANFITSFPANDKPLIPNAEDLVAALADETPSSMQRERLVSLVSAHCGAQFDRLKSADVVVVPPPYERHLSKHDLSTCLFLPWIAKHIMGKRLFWIRPPLALLPDELLPSWHAMLREAEMLWVEDPASLRLAGGTGLGRSRVVPDPIFLTSPLEHGVLYRELEGREYFCAAASTPQNHDALVSSVNGIVAQTGLYPVLVLGGAEQEELRSLLAAKLPHRAFSIMPPQMIYPAVAECLGNAAFLLGDCVQLAKLAAISGTPCVPLSAGDSRWPNLAEMLGVDWRERPPVDNEGILEDVARHLADEGQKRSSLRDKARELRSAVLAAYERWPEELELANKQTLTRPYPLLDAQTSFSSRHPSPSRQPTTAWPDIQILPPLLVMTVYLRRGAETPTSFRCLQQLVEDSLEAALEQLNTRWLVSVCDSYADCGAPLESRNALLISTFINWERFAATYMHWSDPSRSTRVIDQAIPPTNEPLWDGLFTLHLGCGDTTSNLLARYTKALETTPVLLRIWRALLERIKSSDSVMAALDKPHGHLFDEDRQWMHEAVKTHGFARWRLPHPLNLTNEQIAKRPE